MEKKTIVARAKVLAGQEKEFINHAETLIQATRAEEGNISYNLYQDPFSPSSFIFYEEYKDMAAIKAHAASPHFKAFENGIKSLLESELLIETF
ncbi:MAG: antibiotic biosynthesis monooxygenase [Bacteroides sp.]|nr:antibiotic biosynthesis monooxygenase [Bacteroides sp.]